MAASPLGRTLVIANPTAHSMRGAQGIELSRHFLSTHSHATEGYEILVTHAAGDAHSMAASASGFDTVVALGGDGIIHEVVNGLATLPRASRPALGIIPFGSGNDFAKTLGMPINDAHAALDQLVAGKRYPLDLGHVTSNERDSQGGLCETYFMETLSFGLDAAIALDTTDKRSAGTTETGEQLYLTSGLKILGKASAGYACTLSLDDAAPISARTLILAIQNGPTYGGGFKICPEATPTDSQLDVCFNVKKPSVPRALALFGLARFGLHVRSTVIRTARARHIEVTFHDEMPPCQVDGEKFGGSQFTIEIVPHAIDAIVPSSFDFPVPFE